MPKPTINLIRRKVSPEARAKFDEIWHYRLTSNQWPTDRWNYKRLPKPKFDALLRPLNYSYICECVSAGVRTYELQPIGILCTSGGDRYLALLRRFVDHIRYVYFDNDRQNSIQHSELIERTGFTLAETTELGRLLSVSGIFGCAPGHSPDFSSWGAHLPSDLGDILPSEGSTEEAFETLVLRHWHPNLAISYEARARQLHAGSSVLEQLFDVATTSVPKKSKPASRRVRVPAATETKVVTVSRRRCAFCHGLGGILEETEGQIAHIDRDPKNARPENLVWLCFKHHNAYDSSMSQAKGYTPGELRLYRAELWQAIKRKEHLSAARPAVTPSAPGSPYEPLLKTSPRDAVEAAWKDVERAAFDVLETKITFPDPSARIPTGALVTMLRSFGGVDQGNATSVGQLAAIHNAITHGAPVDENAARAYCAAAEPVIVHLRSK
jgi:hypothetical protein